MKVTVSKVVAGGEQVVVELEGPMIGQDQLDAAYRVLDQRLFEMNKRVLAVNEVYKRLVKVHPKAAMMVNDIISILVGGKVFEDTSVEAAVKAAEDQVHG